MATQQYDVLGIGNAIVDVIARAEDDFLVKHAMQKGGMALIDEDRAQAMAPISLLDLQHRELRPFEFAMVFGFVRERLLHVERGETEAPRDLDRLPHATL